MKVCGIDVRVGDEVRILRIDDWLRVTGFGENCFVVRRKGATQFVVYKKEVKGFRTHRPTTKARVDGESVAA